MSALLGALTDLLSPPACAACDEPLPHARAFCARCEVGLSDCDPAECAACGGRAGPRGCCRACARRLAPLAGVRCAFVHEGALAEAIHRLKYRARDDLAPGLADLLGELPLPAADLLVAPVPLHPRRLRERGFDQAWLLARGLAERRGLPTLPRLLQRVRHDRPQVGLDRAGREANVRDAFVAGTQAAGRDVLLVDDVLTTGATLREAARALGRAGARQVFALTLARALE
ncbi:MAG TPA: ComF family protein [Myxococcales bacterium]|nr:ComF family protein [Myxococcales bacterium]